MIANLSRFIKRSKNNILESSHRVIQRSSLFISAPTSSKLICYRSVTLRLAYSQCQETYTFLLDVNGEIHDSKAPEETIR
jgi:hypothetical protein